MTEGTQQTLRIDKWLWQARFFKSRSLAAGLVSAGKVRVDGQPISKPGRGVAVGHVLTFPQGRRIRVVKIAQLGTRRGPASEALSLYEDLSPEPPPQAPRNPGWDGGGRPSGKARRDAARGLGLQRGEDG